MTIRLYLVWIDRPNGLAVVPMLGFDRVHVVGRAVDAAKSRCPAGSKVHLIRYVGEASFPGTKRSQVAPLLRLADEIAFQGLPDRPASDAQRKYSEAISALNGIVDELQANLRKESRDEPT